MSKKLENMDDFEMIDYILEKIRKNHDIIRNINKIDGLTSEHDILSFILERSLNSNKTLFEICKFNIRWHMIDFYRKFKVLNRESELHKATIPLINCEFKLYDDLDLIAYKIDRNYKPYLNLDKYTRSNGRIDSRKLDRSFKIILGDLNIDECKFYDIIEKNKYKYIISAYETEYNDEIMNEIMED